MVKIEQVIDQSSFEFDVAPNHTELRAKLRLDGLFLLQGRHTHEHRGQRRSQLMGESGQEVVFGTVGAFRFVSGVASLCVRKQRLIYHPLTLRDFRL